MRKKPATDTLTQGAEHIRQKKNIKKTLLPWVASSPIFPFSNVNQQIVIKKMSELLAVQNQMGEESWENYVEDVIMKKWNKSKAQLWKSKRGRPSNFISIICTSLVIQNWRGPTLLK